MYQHDVHHHTMAVTFLEADARFFYKILDHQHETELRLLQRGKYPICKIVKDEDRFIEVCRNWSGRRNLYAVLRERQPGLRKPATMFDIVAVQILVLDIDPIRAPETPATEDELSHAIEVGHHIADWFERSGYKRPLLAITGNGVCLYFRIPRWQVTDTNRYAVTDTLQRFESWSRQQFRTVLTKHNCQIDSMYDLPRIGRVIGTLNIKGEPTPTRPWRLAKWLTKHPPVEDAELLKWLQSLKS